MNPQRPPGASRPPSAYAPNFLLDLFGNSLDPGYTDAAARRTAGDRPESVSRAATAMRLVTLAAIGMLLAIAYRQVVAAEPERASAHAGLVREVKQAQTRTDDLQRRAEQLRVQVNTLRTNALAGAGDELRALRTQEAATGFGAVTGSGMTVTLRDAPAPIDPTTGKPTSAEVNRVLDVDVQNVVNGLWASGAEAIAVNGQRLTSTSTIRTAGSAILVDFRPVTSPYTIAAIGGNDLVARFETTGAAAAMRALADQFGLGFAASNARRLTLPAAADVPLRYATPAKGSR